MSQVRTAPFEPRVARPAVPDGPDVSVCIANWNCIELLRRCLQSLFEQDQGARFEVIIADNASTDGAADMVAAEFPDVVLIRNAENYGFARASNQAAAVATGRFLFFLNNDTLVPEHTLRRFLDLAEANPGAGMFGPRLRGADGEFQISYRRRPTLAALLHRIALLRWTGLFRRAYYEYRRDTFDPMKAREVEVLMGAAVFLSRTVFDRVGRWDEAYWFGVEDIDLSTQVSRFGPVLYAASVEIVHYGRAAGRTNINFAAPNVAIGYVHYFRKCGTGPLALFAYKALVTIDAPLQLTQKLVEAVWRRATGQRAKAHNSLVAARGLWAFLRRELLRFWKA
ncbi:glycosyltransferase family 2 protein [Gemmata sp. JC673]|uniref:Glycosyltransferase family 2 protein n=1 Tax=Gemmata algarum TaxID=2975278 RepID=A0ABU5EW34_9BACT|nr:glycosyltransferase family 2 protein [Gemmata algarum]MDY3558677.1 glycosyltransferase family 2 protein [Gemmata algarum]